MVSAEGELVPLKTRIKPSAVGGAVEKWLIQVLMLAHMSQVPARTASQLVVSFCVQSYCVQNRAVQMSHTQNSLSDFRKV